MHNYSKKWCFEANVAKCAVVVFRNEKELDGAWTWVTLFCGVEWTEDYTWQLIYLSRG